MNNRFIISPTCLDEAVPELESLAQPDWIVNKPSLPQCEKQVRMSVIHRHLAESVYEAVRAGERPVSIAGDCCSAIGVLAGLQWVGIDPALIWFDAHGDFNTWETSPSGFLGGMPLAMIVGRGEQIMIKAADLLPLSEDVVVLSDARSLDPFERKSLEKSAITHLKQPESLVKHTVPDKPLYVHFDTDIINPDKAPAMNYPAPGGPSASVLHYIFRQFPHKKRIVAVSMSTWNPKLDEEGNSKRVCMKLLQTLIDIK
jgi:arginase